MNNFQRTVLTGLAALIAYSSVQAADFKLLRIPKNDSHEINTHVVASADPLVFRQYSEIKTDGAGGHYTENTASLPIARNDDGCISAFVEYDGAPGPDHVRAGLMANVSIENIDLLVRAAYDDQQDIHLRGAVNIETPFGTLGYALSNMDSNGNNHQRISYKLPIDGLIDDAYLFTQARTTSGDGEGPTMYIGVGINK